MFSGRPYESEHCGYLRSSAPSLCPFTMDIVSYIIAKAVLSSICCSYCMSENLPVLQKLFSNSCTVCGAVALLSKGSLIFNLTLFKQLAFCFSPVSFCRTEYQRKAVFQSVFCDICICTAHEHMHICPVFLQVQLLCICFIPTALGLYLSLRYMLSPDVCRVHCIWRTNKETDL